MECVELVKAKIDTVQKESVKSAKQIEAQINSYLDRVIECGKIIDEVNSMLIECNELLYNSKQQLGELGYLEIKPGLLTLKNKISKFYAVVRNSDTYVGVKDKAKDYHSNLEDLNEYIADMELIVALNHDEDYHKIAKKLNSVLAK